MNALDALGQGSIQGMGKELSAFGDLYLPMAMGNTGVQPFTCFDSDELKAIRAAHVDAGAIMHDGMKDGSVQALSSFYYTPKHLQVDTEATRLPNVPKPSSAPNSLFAMQQKLGEGDKALSMQSCLRAHRPRGSALATR